MSGTPRTAANIRQSPATEFLPGVTGAWVRWQPGMHSFASRRFDIGPRCFDWFPSPFARDLETQRAQRRFASNHRLGNRHDLGRNLRRLDDHTFCLILAICRLSDSRSDRPSLEFSKASNKADLVILHLMASAKTSLKFVVANPTVALKSMTSLTRSWCILASRGTLWKLLDLLEILFVILRIGGRVVQVLEEPGQSREVSVRFVFRSEKIIAVNELLDKK